MSQTFRCELLLAYDDRTWDTEVFDVPVEYSTNEDAIAQWWYKAYSGAACYRKVCCVTVYNIQPDEE